MTIPEIIGPRPNLRKGTMTASRFRINLGKDAVKLALDGQWERAAEINRAILELYPDDCEAANRLAKALMELSDYPSARTVLNDLCARHPGNNIARKNLARLEALESTGAPRPSTTTHAGAHAPLFIEEGGKSCTTGLRGSGDESALADTVAGDSVSLTVSGEFVVAHAGDGRQLGTVEPRLARRLRKLMDGGNQYSAAVVSVTGNTLSIVIRETRQDPSLRNVVSFPPLRRHEDAPGETDPDGPGEEFLETAEGTDPVADAGDDSEPDDALPTLGSEDIEEDGDDGGDGDEGPDDDVPVLDTDDVNGDPILEIVPRQDEDDWE